MTGAYREQVEAYVAVGSNIDPRANVIKAVRMLAHRLPLTGVSTFWRTDSIGPDGTADGSPEFINGVVRLLAESDARRLKFDIMRPIEADLGRGARNGPARFAPRTIDLDLVLFGRQVIDEPDLRIPAPDVCRPYVAAGLLELDPELVLPGSGQVLACLWPGGWAGMTADVELTRSLKELCCK